MTSVIKVYKQLSKGGGDMALFQTALNTAHYGGLMIEHVQNATDITKGLLDDLSAGKFTAQWDTDIHKMAQEDFGLRKQADEQRTDALSREQLQESARVLEDIERSERAAKERKQQEAFKQLEPEARTDLPEPHYRTMAEQKPVSFLSYREVADAYPQYRTLAAERLIATEPATYFLGGFYQRPEFKALNQRAVLRLMAERPEVYFNLGLYLQDEFKLLKRPAAYAVARYEPRYFLDVLLKVMPEFEDLKSMADESLTKKASISCRAEEGLKGWWLSKDGKVYDVGSTGHVEFIVAHPDLFKIDWQTQPVYETAYNNGWIRLGTSGALMYVELHGPFNDHLLRLVQEALSKLPLTKQVVVYESDAPGSFRTSPDYDYALFMGAGSVSDLRKHSTASISKRALFYQWWLSPDGVVYPATLGHETYAFDHPELFGELDEHLHGDELYNELFDRGWIRVASVGSRTLTFELPLKPSIDVFLPRIQNALKDLPHTAKVIVDQGTAFIDTDYALLVGAGSTKDLKINEQLADTQEPTYLNLEHYALTPIAPMRLKRIKGLDELLDTYAPEDLVVQPKYDGFKCQAIKSTHAKVFSRRGVDFSANVPQLTNELDQLLPDATFVMGELCWIGDDGKQYISDVQTVINSTPEHAQAHANGNLVYYVYDLLWLKGQNLTKHPLSERYQKLSELVKGDGMVQLVPNYTWNQRNQALSDALAAGGEGVVIKCQDSTYEYSTLGESERFGSQFKFKPGQKAHEADVVVKEYHKGKDKLVFPAYQYRDGALFEVGQISGLPKDDEAQVKTLIDQGKVVVLEVGYQEVMSSGKFRHPGYHRVRTDKSPKDATFKD